MCAQGNLRVLDLFCRAYVEGTTLHAAPGKVLCFGAPFAASIASAPTATLTKIIVKYQKVTVL